MLKLLKIVFSSSENEVKFLSKISTVPLSSFNMVLIIERRVVLPQPDGPIRKDNSPLKKSTHAPEGKLLYIAYAITFNNIFTVNSNFFLVHLLSDSLSM